MKKMEGFTILIVSAMIVIIIILSALVSVSLVFQHRMLCIRRLIYGHIQIYTIKEKHGVRINGITHIVVARRVSII
jgi:hypothetical protein